MSKLSLEWSGPAGPVTLALLAGPWRRRDDVTESRERFCVRVPIDVDDLPRVAATEATGGSAMTRLLALLRHPPRVLPAAQAELLRALRGEPASERIDDVTLALHDLSCRAVAPARVETVLGDHVCAVTEIPASGSLVTHMLAATPGPLVTLHREAVAAALATRVALLRTALETTRLAGVLAAAAGPAALWLALPLAWRFLNTVLAEHAPSPDGV